MKGAWIVLAAAALTLVGRSALGQTKVEVFEVDYDNPQLAPAQWTMVLHPDGSGHFQSLGSGSPSDASDIKTPSVDRDIRVSPEFAAQLFATAHRHKFFNMNCESHLKVAFQGWKTFTYTGPAGKGSCRFNYSKDKEIEALGDSLVAVESTIMEGARLEILLKHDRLGLDSEMEYLVEAAKDGRAQQICVISGILKQLAGDPEVLDRVRERADMLLEKAKT